MVVPDRECRRLASVLTGNTIVIPENALAFIRDLRKIPQCQVEETPVSSIE
jgi:hypothetical protein